MSVSWGEGRGFFLFVHTLIGCAMRWVPGPGVCVMVGRGKSRVAGTAVHRLCIVYYLR